MSSLFRLVIAVVLFTASHALYSADSTPDLSDYKTVETSKATTPKSISLPNAFSSQPGHLGINVELNEKGQLHVAQIESGSAAAKAGVKVGDLVRSACNRPVANVAALRDILLNHSAGESISLSLIRDKQPVELSIKLSPASSPMTVSGAPARVVIGVRFSTVAKGVKIEHVERGAPAETAGLRVGDIITKVDSVEATTQDRVREYLGSHKAGDKVKIGFLRDDRQLFVDVELVFETVISDQPTLAGWDDRRSGVFRRDVYRLAVVPIIFPDVKLNEQISTKEWEKALFSTDTYKERSVTGQYVYGSMNDYYREISCGKFSVSGKVFAGVTVSKKRAEYSSTANRNALLTEALDVLLARDGDEALKDFDGVFYVYAGNRVQTQRGGIYWPHRSSVSYKGRRWPYFICPEGGERMSSISVISHEFGHMLGLPDLYAKPENPGSEGVGVWCTMSTGHGQDGKPLHFSAWCKEQMGWLKPTVIDPSVKQKLILAPINGSNRECYKVLIKPDGSEYLLLENRLKKGFDCDIPGEGLLVWRVLDGRPILEESHGVSGPDGPRRFLGSVPYPSKANTAFTPYTTPSSKPNKPGGLPVHITNIQKLPDGRIIFHIGYEYL